MMPSIAPPLDLATAPRQGPASVHHQQSSNLTTALQSTSGNEARPTPAMNIGDGNKGFGNGFGYRDSVTQGNTALGSGYPGGAQPISMDTSNRKNSRRESIASSLAGGMSWGGVSVGSWIRDDIIMQGSSPFGYSSPSFHSSSYLPKLEANFMRDFSCCGLTLPTLHHLFQHYDACHPQQTPPSLQKQASVQAISAPDSKAAIAAGAAAAVQERAHQQQQQQQQTEPSVSSQPSPITVRSSTPVTPRTTQPLFCSAAIEHTPQPVQSAQDMDTVQDMEMDEETVAPMPNVQAQYPLQDQPRIMPRSQFGQPPSTRATPLDLNTLDIGNPHQGLRNSTPTTPVTAGRIGNFYQNNPTVSSVNTPTLTAHPHQQQHQRMNTPDPSTPETPGNLKNGFSHPFNVTSMSNSQPFIQNDYAGFGGSGYDNSNEMLDLYIDEPAKRLFALDGGFNNPQQLSCLSKLGDGNYSEDSELARTIREQQRMAGVPDPQLNDNIPKPFHCPVIGCEKAYKNQNGLKYHKSHGHNTQQLTANENGTFSIVDPETLSPYPGTLGMEKHKPYRCEVCGKRYKNLNGLKYHKNHSPACDAELKLHGPGHPQDQQTQAHPLSETQTSGVPGLAPGIPGFGGAMGLEEEMVM